MVRDVGYPIVTADVVEAEDVEAVEAEPDVAQIPETTEMLVFVVNQTIVHTDIKTTVGRSTEGIALESCMWWSERQSVGKGGLEVHLPARGAREIVSEEEVDVVPLVGGLRYLLSGEIHRGFHQAEAYP